MLAITVTTTLTAIGNYYLDQKDIQDHLDTLMVLSTMNYNALLGQEMSPKAISAIQKSLDNLPADITSSYNKRFINSTQQNYANNFILQVWSSKGELLLHSPTAPAFSLAGDKEGFSDSYIDGNLWRIFTNYQKNPDVITVVAERYDNRNQLGRRIAQDDLYIMLLTFPLSGLLIWIIIGKGLSALKRVAQEVSNRAASYLEPVDIKYVPDEIKPVIDEINNLFSRLQDAFEREKRFASDAAHELRTPLAALKTQAQVAMRTEDKNEREIALHNVIAGVNRSSHIVQQLLTMSRLVPEASALDDVIDVNLEKLSAEIIAQLVPSAIEKEIDIELQTDDTSPNVRGNITALSILIRNLVDNAIRYTPEHGHVTVSIFNKDDMTVLQVADTGPGIPEELRERVFERFFRILGSKVPGSGLGLAIVTQIVKLHKANIVLDAPEKGTGLIIEIRFPHRDKEKL